MNLIRQLRMNVPASTVEETCRANLMKWYSIRREWYKLERKLLLTSDQEISRSYANFPFPLFSENWVAKYKALINGFLGNYLIHKDDLLRELKYQRSTHCISIDHKAGDVKKVRIDKDKNDIATQTLSIIGDYNIILNLVCTPSTAGDWSNKAMNAVVQRHGNTCPKYIYVDCGCCSDSDVNNDEVQLSLPLWKQGCTLCLDSFHSTQRVVQDMNSGNPRTGPFAKIYARCLKDESQEEAARLNHLQLKHNLRLTLKQKKEDRQKHIRHGPAWDEMKSVAKICLAVKACIVQDKEVMKQCIKQGLPVNNLTKQDIAYPVMTKKVLRVIHNQIKHVQRGCLKGPLVPYVCVKKVNYRNTGDYVNEY